METKFTKGTWQVDDRDFVISGTTTIAEFYNSESYVPKAGTKVPSPEESAANARLIAAAPDLYEALDILMMAISGMKYESQEQADLILDAKAIAATAFKKATP